MLVAVGGDGTVHEIVNGAGGSNVPVGIIPAGSANDLAARLGIPAIPEDACDVILSGRTEMVDVMQVNGIAILTTCGLGFPAAVIKSVRDIFKNSIWRRIAGRRLGSGVYAVGVMVALAKRLPYTSFRICCDDRVREISSMSLIIGLQSNLGSHFIPLPHLNPCGALMAVYSINTDSRMRLACHVMRTTRGTQGRLADAHFMQARRISLTLPAAVPFFGDGELLGIGQQFDISHIPKAIPMIVPSSRRDRSC
jgi:diacylglycerol kinase family enzyme